MPKYIDVDALKRKVQKTATEAWKMKLTANVETTLNQFIDWIDEMPTVTINDPVTEIKVTNCHHNADDSKKVGRYTFGNDEFNLESAYHDCKLVFDGITDDDSFQEADTGLILYYANEIIYALHEALQGKDTNVPSKDVIYRQSAIDALLDELMEKPERYEDGLDRHDIEAVLGTLPSVQPNVTGINSGDIISREMVIDTLNKHYCAIEQANGRPATKEERAFYFALKMAYAWLPSAQPEQAVKDCRNCKHGKYNDHLETHFCYNPNECIEWNLWESIAQSEPEEFEWCTDCKEYDQTAHCCHRFTKVIRQTVEEIKAEQPERKTGFWIPQDFNKSNGMATTAVYYFPKCSICGHAASPTNFCPACGADMRGDEHD